jgi:NAD kinase
VVRNETRIVIIVRSTRLEQILESQNTNSQAKFYITSLGGDFGDYEEEHNRYLASIEKVKRAVSGVGNVQILKRHYLTNFIFAKDDIVVVIGQDGLVANAMKYLDGQPVIGINPDPGRWDGVLLPFLPQDALTVIKETAEGKRKFKKVSMARARVQNGQELLAVNDFFIGQKTHVSARYIIKFGGYREPQSSSGVIVSTGLGSTGWMKSVIAGASRISESVIGRPYGSKQESAELAETNDKPVFHRLPEKALHRKKMSYGISELSETVGKWDSRDLLFAVREPFPSKTTGTDLVFGKITPELPLQIESLMGEDGVIFSDGIQSDYIRFNSGTEVQITLADKEGKIVV